jgi:isocitrate lyase
MFELARNYAQRGMAAYSQLQEAEFTSEKDGYTATRHQREVGTSYFDAVSNAISGGQSSTTAMAASTEAQQFHPVPHLKDSHLSVEYSRHTTANGVSIDEVYRRVQDVHILEEFKEVHYAQLKEAYKEIEEFTRVDEF